MSETGLDYPRLIADALRDVARRALLHAAEHGLPGEHHFYLTFRTEADEVHLPDFLRQQYPGEMTVVLQNQYWDLVVDDWGFSVTLAFGGSRHRIGVPFGALSAFADPAAQVGLRFEPPPEGEGEEAAGEGTEPGTEPAPDPGDDTADVPADAGGQVVNLESFRKRND